MDVLRIVPKKGVTPELDHWVYLASMRGKGQKCTLSLQLLFAKIANVLLYIYLGVTHIVMFSTVLSK